RSTSSVTSITHAGPTKRCTGMVSQLWSRRSLPVTQWIGASKCVPVCSPNLSVFQYQAGPLSSYREITSIDTPGDAAKIGGRPMIGVRGPSGCVRSTIRNRPACRSSRSCASVDATGQIPLKFEPVLEQRAIGDVSRRANDFDLPDKRCQPGSAKSFIECAGELVHCPRLVYELRVHDRDWRH